MRSNEGNSRNFATTEWDVRTLGIQSQIQENPNAQKKHCLSIILVASMELTLQQSHWSRIP